VNYPSPSPSPSFGLLSTVLQRELWGVSPLFMAGPVWPKPKCVGLVRSSKIKKSKIFFLIYFVLLKKLVFNINQ
jgi:hypothetical protein